MENSKESSCIRNMVWSKQSLLPPKCPFPSISPSFSDYIPNSAIGSRPIQKPREGNSHHQRTFSESVIIEEQPSWLDDLLNEPETPVRKVGHRRSSSDSFAYIDATNAAYRDHASLNEYKFKNQASGPLWIPHKMGCFKDTRHASFTVESNSGGKPMKTWDLSSNSVNCSSGHPSVVDDTVPQTSGSSCALLDADGAASTATEKKESIDCSPNNTKGSSEKKDCSSAKPSTSETDTKRAKQQYAQRSRVRKLQYIAELERNVQALQAEGSEVSAELEFMNQQNLILSMENKALKQRLESLAQEHLIKHLEQDVLEREIVRLRAMFQQHHHPQQQKPSAHRRNSSRDVDSQFANLSLKHREAGSAGWDPVSGHLNIRQST